MTTITTDDDRDFWAGSDFATFDPAAEAAMKAAVDGFIASAAEATAEDAWARIDSIQDQVSARWPESAATDSDVRDHAAEYIQARCPWIDLNSPVRP